MNYRELPPPPDLAPFVRCFWLLEAAPDPHAPVEPVLPDGCVELVVHFGDRFVRHVGGERRVQSRALFAGQIAGPLVVAATGRVGVVAARFRLGGAAPFLGGRPLLELTDRDVDAADLWPGTRALVDAVGSARTDAERVAHLAAFLRRRLRLTRSWPAIAAAARWFEEPGALRVDDLAARLRVGPRQLQRLFAEQVGLGPKRLARVRRFQDLLAAVRSALACSFATLAARCGYADQAHLVRDFRELAGTTPARWLREHTPMAAVLAGFDRPDVASVQGGAGCRG